RYILICEVDPETNKGTLWRVSIWGGVPRKLLEFTDAANPGMHPDGSRIVFYSNRSGRYEFWTIRPDGSALQQLTRTEGTSVWFPLFSPDVLDSLLEISADLIQHGSANLVTAKSKIIAEEKIFSPNTVKVVTDCKDQALYFSRSPIPYIEKGSIGKSGLPFNYYKHYGIYIYKRDFLLHIARSPEGPLEKAERLEQLRVLEQGDCVRVVEIDPEAARSFCEVNTPEDLIRAKALLSSKHIVG
ncbi:MAG: cytidylyltransferase domain-containing protein, partial [Nitrospiria bacterium]